MVRLLVFFGYDVQLNEEGFIGFGHREIRQRLIDSEKVVNEASRGSRVDVVFRTLRVDPEGLGNVNHRRTVEMFPSVPDQLNGDGNSDNELLRLRGFEEGGDFCDCGGMWFGHVTSIGNPGIIARKKCATSKIYFLTSYTVRAMLAHICTRVQKPYEGGPCKAKRVALFSLRSYVALRVISSWCAYELLGVYHWRNVVSGIGIGEAPIKRLATYYVLKAAATFSLAMRLRSRTARCPSLRTPTTLFLGLLAQRVDV